MNTDTSYVSGGTRSPNVLAACNSAPFGREMLSAIKAGQAEFAALLARTGLLSRFGLSASAVHDYHDVEVHALILGIVSAARPEEVQTKSFLTYASHWIDDFFDGDQESGNFAQLMADRHDLARALTNMGPAGTVGFAMAERVRHPAAVNKALHRMLYGGLVQRSKSRLDRECLVREYVSLGLKFVDPDLCADIRRLRPQVYWTTNKTVLELLFAAEERVDFTRSELWSLLYAPAIFYQDSEEERARGELAFDHDEEPKLDEMLAMIRVATHGLEGSLDAASLEIEQLRFATSVLPNLPERVADLYRALCAGAESRSARDEADAGQAEVGQGR